MGIRISELLNLEGFSGYKVLAGHGGLNNEVQGITVMEAPDCFKWVRGKELVLSSGYVIATNPGCLEQGFEDGAVQYCSGFILKRERYISKVPDNILALFDANNIPLISMPFSISWMELTREVNTAAMNRAIARFHVQDNNLPFVSDQSYAEQKIHSILQAVEKEMHFPAFLYDLSEGKSYFSSSNFSNISTLYNLNESDYWNPTRPFTRHVLCDHTHMTRIRLINGENDKSVARISWILTPIIVNDTVQAYFVVMESREFIDYYDEYSIRISNIMLQNLYEQIYAAKSVGDMRFEGLLQFAMTCDEADISRLDCQAASMGLSLNKRYTAALITPRTGTEQKVQSPSLRDERALLNRAFHQSRISADGRIAIIDDNQTLVLFDAESGKYGRNESIVTLLSDFSDNLAKTFGIEFLCAYHTENTALRRIGQTLEKCHNAMNCGKALSPEKNMWNYDDLGPFAWFSVSGAEANAQLRRYGLHMDDEKNRELVYTLRVYLNSNMNFSETAEKMFLHINTVRKRIDRVTELLPIDLSDPMERLKLTILLQFI